jgi:hypothetical protein
VKIEEVAMNSIEVIWGWSGHPKTSHWVAKPPLGQNGGGCPSSLFFPIFFLNFFKAFNYYYFLFYFIFYNFIIFQFF